jgi:GNAT superfamily N-acetyltransferase
MEATRLATTADHPLCLDLVERVLSDARSMRGGATLAGSATAPGLLARWSAEVTPAVLLVGEFHDVVVGLAAAVIVDGGSNGSNGGGSAAQALDRAPKTGRIECLYVETEARGVGVGSALMAATVDWCRTQGCTEVDALALPGDRSTKQRLEGAGFTARLLTLSRRLD